nr:MAG TPA: hypothetical protein [Caudoviricetes sp.]
MISSVHKRFILYDTNTATDKTWSSSKISTQFKKIAYINLK